MIKENSQNIASLESEISSLRVSDYILLIYCLQYFTAYEGFILAN